MREDYRKLMDELKAEVDMIEARLDTWERMRQMSPSKSFVSAPLMHRQS